MNYTTSAPFLTWSPDNTADRTCGSICFLLFLIGTLGNIVSFLYFKFKSKRRDISSVIYQIITANDTVISLTILPVGISYWSRRDPGPLFGNRYGCAAWVYLWEISVSLSVFLVTCLSITRTISLLVPFMQQKVRYLTMAVLIYSGLMLGRTIILHTLEDIEILFSVDFLQCGLFLTGRPNPAVLLCLLVSRNIAYTVPAFVVAISCVISAVLLTRRNKQVQGRELQQSRNRATVTILLFALLYGVCNLPLVVDLILRTHSMRVMDAEWYFNIYAFDKKYYYRTITTTLLLAANSAANPILYFLRMPHLRGVIVTRCKQILGLNRVVALPTSMGHTEISSRPGQ